MRYFPTFSKECNDLNLVANTIFEKVRFFEEADISIEDQNIRSSITTHHAGFIQLMNEGSILDRDAACRNLYRLFYL